MQRCLSVDMTVSGVTSNLPYYSEFPLPLIGDFEKNEKPWSERFP